MGRCTAPPLTPVKRAELPRVCKDQITVVRGQQALLSFRWLILIKEKDLHNRQHLLEQKDRGLLGKVSQKTSFKIQAGKIQAGFLTHMFPSCRFRRGEGMSLECLGFVLPQPRA